MRRRSTCRSKTDCNIDQDEDILEHCKALDTWFGYEQHETHITLGARVFDPRHDAITFLIRGAENYERLPGLPHGLD